MRVSRLALPVDRKFYLGVFAVSGILMALQVLQARIFSVTTWYHISFLVISAAMFGLTMGALHVQRGVESEQRENFATLMAESCQQFAFSMITALLAQLLIPIIIVDQILFTLITLPIVSYFVVWPYYHAGVVLSLAITRAPFPVAQTYGIDLLGAAAGCLFALFIMNTIDAPSAVLLLALMAILSSRCFAKLEGQEKIKALAKPMLILLVLILNLVLPSHIIYPIWVKTKIVPDWLLAHDEWNSISRVTVTKENKDAEPYLWGPSSKLPKDLKQSYYRLQIDGSAETPICQYTPDTNLDLLNYDVTTIAYALPDLKSAVIIGLGGGRDVLSAHHAGVEDISALDINDVQIKLLSKKEPFVSYAGLSKMPKLHMIHSEARSWLSRSRDTFDIIQMSLIDTWAATGAGAFALSENGLYTLEAWKTYLTHLNPHGVMTVSRWYVKDAHSEIERLMSLATASLLATGATHPKDHIYLAASNYIATLVLGRDPLTQEQLDALDKRAKEMDFKIVLSPRVPSNTPELSSILNAGSIDALFQYGKNSIYDVSPPTDRRPFFFNQVRVTQPDKVFRLISENSTSSNLGHARAVFSLYLIIAFSLLMVLGVIIFPLRSALKGADKSFVCAGTLWFLLIGLGFMFIEISFLQRMSIYLGHPSYGLGIVLFSLVLSTGIGSLASGRFPLSSTALRLAWIALTAGMTCAEIALINQAFLQFDGADMTFRILLCIGLVLPMGFLFGFGFPTGMGLTGPGGKNLTAWFWGINGAAGVLGSAIAIAISIAAGLDTTMMAGAACYGLLLIPTLMLRRSEHQLQKDIE